MGDTHVGLQARLMSQALRKLTANLNKSNTICIFINQLREKIGVMFGCLSYGTRVTLADGTQEKIGKIVNQKLPVEVLSYDPELGAVVPKKVVNWFDNGRTDEFLQFTVARAAATAGRSSPARPTTRSGRRAAGARRRSWRSATGCCRRCRTASPTSSGRSLLGGLMGDGALSPTRSGHGARFRWGHGAKQADVRRLEGIAVRQRRRQPLDERQGRGLPRRAAAARAGRAARGRLRRRQEGAQRRLPEAAHAAVAGHLVHGRRLVHARGPRACRSAPGTAAAESRSASRPWSRHPGAAGRLPGRHLGHPPDARRTRARRRRSCVFPKDETAKLHALIAPFVHPSMEYKLLPALPGPVRGRAGVRADAPRAGAACRSSTIDAQAADAVARTASTSRSRARHNYFVDGVMVHNSPETTPGGRALKFYSSVRLDIRRIESIKDGVEVVGNRTRVKVVKNKVRAAVPQAEFDIMYGKGISREGSLLDIGVDLGIVKKSGAWYTYEGEQLGQGRENAKAVPDREPRDHGRDLRADPPARSASATRRRPRRAERARRVATPTTRRSPSTTDAAEPHARPDWHALRSSRQGTVRSAPVAAELLASSRGGLRPGRDSARWPDAVGAAEHWKIAARSRRRSNPELGRRGRWPAPIRQTGAVEVQVVGAGALEPGASRRVAIARGLRRRRRAIDLVCVPDLRRHRDRRRAAAPPSACAVEDRYQRSATASTVRPRITVDPARSVDR